MGTEFYREAEMDELDIFKREMVDQLIQRGRQELSINPRIRLMVAADAASAQFKSDSPVDGAASDHAIMVRVDLEPDRIAEVIGHEMQHHWQLTTYRGSPQSPYEECAALDFGKKFAHEHRDLVQLYKHQHNYASNFHIEGMR